MVLIALFSVLAVFVNPLWFWVFAPLAAGLVLGVLGALHATVFDSDFGEGLFVVGVILWLVGVVALSVATLVLIIIAAVTLSPFWLFALLGYLVSADLVLVTRIAG